MGHVFVIDSIIATCNMYYTPTTKPTIDSVQNILRDAYISTDENYGIEEAIQWADGFEIPSSAVDSDMRKFLAAGLDFKIMVKRQLSVNAAKRLSRERVDRLLPDNPEIEKLYDLPDEIDIPHRTTFIPNASSITTQPRDLYTRRQNVVRSSRARTCVYPPRS